MKKDMITDLQDEHYLVRIPEKEILPEIREAGNSDLYRRSALEAEG